MEVCLLCDCPDKNYRPAPDVEFVCSQCVIRVVDADEVSIKRAYDTALAKGLNRKARALESLFEEEEIKNDTKAQKSKRNIVRKRTMRLARPSRYQIGAQSAAIELDKGRA